MTIYSQNEVMKTAMVSELRSKLSVYLAEVRGGASIDDLVIIEAAASPAELKRIKGVRPKKPIDVDKLLADLRKDR